MATSYTVQITSFPSQLNPKQLRIEIDDRLQTINAIMSTYDPNSAISILNRSSAAGWTNTDPELVALVARSIELSNQSESAFDITVGPLVNLWGFGNQQAIASIPPEEDIKLALQAVGVDNIRADISTSAVWKKIDQVEIDLSAIAKGYAVDQIATILQAYKIENFMAELGGEIRAQGFAPHGDYWHIGIESPDQSSGKRKIPIVLKLENMAVATSGDYRNFFFYQGKRYAHTIDPQTGRPSNSDLASVTILHTSAERADALATAMMVMGLERSRRFADTHQLPAVLITRSNDNYHIETNEWIQPFLTNI